MKVYINRTARSGPWGGGNAFVKAFHKHVARDGIELMNGDQTMNINPDVILLAGLQNEGPLDISAEQAIMYKLYNRPDCRIVLRVNENDARKGTSGVDELLLKVSHHVDTTVFVSRWLQEYFQAKGWGCSDQHVIVNGVDREVFKQQPKLNNGKLNIVAHHWSDNYMKGFDVYDKLDEFVGKHSDAFAFTYIGRQRGTFKHTNVVKPLSGKALGEELGKHDVYISASRHDPGPNHVIEALACGLPTYVHVDGGGCVEFAGADHTYYTWEQLEGLLLKHAEHGYMSRPNSFVTTTWQDCIAEYSGLLEATWKASTSGSHSS